MRKSFVVLSAAAVVAVAAGYYLYSRPGESAVAYQTAKVERGSLTKTVSASGV